MKFKDAGMWKTVEKKDGGGGKKLAGKRSGQMSVIAGDEDKE